MNRKEGAGLFKLANYALAFLILSSPLNTAFAQSPMQNLIEGCLKDSRFIGQFLILEFDILKSNRPQICNLLYRSEALRSLGKNEEAVRVLCNDPVLREALISDNDPCKVDRSAEGLTGRSGEPRNSSNRSQYPHGSINRPYGALCVPGQRFIEVRGYIHPC